MWRARGSSRDWPCVRRAQEVVIDKVVERIVEKIREVPVDKIVEVPPPPLPPILCSHSSRFSVSLPWSSPFPPS